MLALIRALLMRSLSARFGSICPLGATDLVVSKFLVAVSSLALQLKLYFKILFEQQMRIFLKFLLFEIVI
jgi:hypothetical protein